MKKLLISVLALVMSVSVALGFAACNGGSSDEEIATKAIDTVNVLYVDSAASTPEDYTVIGQARVDDKLYPIDWSVSPDSAKDYAKVGTMDETTKMVTIDITRTTVDVEYTLKASVTVGSATKTAEFTRKIPKKSSEDAVTATLDLTARDNRTSLDTDNNEQVWKQNGVTLTNSGSVADYVPIRLYKNTTVSIEMENARIIHIDFHSAQGYDDNPYPEDLKTSLENSELPIKGEIAVSEDGLTLGVDFETAQEVVTFKTTAGQCRLTSIDVEALERDPNEHVHQWTYEHIANTWTHTATCTAEGCDVNTKTEACTPKLNVCECGYTYSAKEIVDALFALETGKSLPGTYTLTGLVTKVTELDTKNYKNVTFDMTVEGKTVTVFRAKGSHYADVREGGYATVNGELLDYGGKKEFTQGGSVVEFNDERTAQQKVDAALKALKDTFTVNKTGETDLPASTESDVTFTWATTDQTYPIANNKITVNALPAADATVTATVTATCGAEAVTNNTKTVTITIKAEGAATNYGTLEKPLTVAEVIALANTIGGNGYLGGADEPIQIIVKGIVIVTGTFTTYKNWQNAYIADTADASSNDNTKAAQVYRLAADGTFLKAEGDLVVGATITIQGWLQSYNGKAEVCHNQATSTDCKAVAYSKENVTPPTPSDADAMLSFAADTNRTEITEDKEVWVQNGITFTKNKGTGSAIDTKNQYFNPIRIYKNHIVKIEYTSPMETIVFHCATYQSNDYPGTLKSALTGTGYTVTVDELDVIVILDTPSTTFEFTNSEGQVRLNSIEVYTKAVEPQPGPSEHVHNYVYTYSNWKHTGTCTADGCDEPTLTEEACTPELNVCSKCKHEFTEDEILTKLFGLSGDTVNLPGTYSLTGKVMRIDTAYSSQFGNVSFWIKVGEREIEVYREKSDYSSKVKPGDTVTVTGSLCHYYTGVKEFNAGCAITTLTPGTLTAEEKLAEAKLALTLPASTKEDITLPTLDETVFEGVTLTWQSDNDALKVEGNTLKVTQSDTQVNVAITVTIACDGATSQTKTFTVAVEAALPQDAVTASVTMSEYAAAHGWDTTGKTKYSSVEADEHVTISTSGSASGANNGKYYATNGGTWRLYKSESATLTIAVEAGYHLISVKITFGSGSFVASDGISSGVAKNVSGTSVTFTVNANIQITAFEVLYAPDATAAANLAPVAILPGKQF